MNRIQQRLSLAFGDASLPYPLFYGHRPGLRFELGGVHYDAESMLVPRFMQAFDRARCIAREIFNPADQASVIISYRGEAVLSRMELKIVKAIKRLGMETQDFGEPERIDDKDSAFIEDFGEDTFRYLHCFDLPRLTPDMDTLLWASITRELPISPGISRRNRSADIYLVSFPKRIIMHVYDDRGMDVVGHDMALLSGLYEKFNTWLLDYDREKMDRTFKKTI